MEWRDIAGYEGIYQVSNTGEVKSLWFGKEKIRPPQKHTAGYKMIHLYKGSAKGKARTIHRLVAEAFLPNPENKSDVNHIDGDKANNHLHNLEWVSRKENMAHAMEAGLIPTRKLTQVQADEIHTLLSSTRLKGTEIAKMYGVSHQLVSEIKRNNRWKVV